MLMFNVNVVYTVQLFQARIYAEPADVTNGLGVVGVGWIGLFIYTLTFLLCFVFVVFLVRTVP